MRESLSIGEGKNIFDRYYSTAKYSTATERGTGAFGARFSVKEAGVASLSEEQLASIKKIAAERGVNFKDHGSGILEFNRQGFRVHTHFDEGAKEAREHESLKDVIPSVLPHEHGDVQAVLSAVRKAFGHLTK